MTLSHAIQHGLRRGLGKQVGKSLRCLATAGYDVDHLYDKNHLNIPSLPLPQVNDTLKRYLETVRPLTSDEEFEQTSRFAAEFESSIAPELQRELEILRDSPGYPYSYIEKFWDDMYLGGRWPAMVHVNPFYILNDEVTGQEQNARAAAFINSVSKFWTKVVSGHLEPDTERGNPLCMYQYALLFGGKRVPKLGRDLFIPQPRHARHIIVIHKGEYYKVDVLDENRKPIASNLLQQTFERITSESKDRSVTYPDVGVFTTGERDAFATRRDEMIRTSNVNAHSFSTVDDSLFVLVLEHDAGDSTLGKSKMALHGRDGSNRWFDKHQVIVDSAGSLMLNFEHSNSDGMTWNRMLHEAWHDMKGMDSGFSLLPQNGSMSSAPSAEKLTWELSPEMLRALEEEAGIAKALADDVDTYILEFEEFGRNGAKQMKMSPDACAQMAMQLGYYRLHGHVGATYEACSVKNWNHGRTETIRSCTTESKEMCEAFMSPIATPETKKELLLRAASNHVNVAKGAKAALGEFQGVDRHLFALKNIAMEKGLSVPFFEDPVYSRSSTWVLSTSNVTTDFYDLFGFGAVAANGYGLGYQTLAESFPFNITSFKSNEETSSEKLGKAIAESLSEFKEVCK